MKPYKYPIIEEHKYFNQMVFRICVNSPLDCTWTLFTQLKNDYRHCRLLVKDPTFEKMKTIDRAAVMALYEYTKGLLIFFYKSYRLLLQLNRTKRHAENNTIPNS